VDRSVEIPHLEISPCSAASRPALRVILKNAEPVRLTLKNAVVQVESAHLTGPATNVTLAGNVSLKDAKNPLDLRLNGTIDLTVLESLDRDLSASGTLVADANIRGPLTQPLVAGRMQLKDANISLATFPNGLSNANGAILFSGDRATIQNLTGEIRRRQSIGDWLRFIRRWGAGFPVEAAASQMRVRYPEGVSTVADAKLAWTGTMQRSLASGSITILRTGFNARTDLGSVLAKSAQPVRTPATRTGYWVA